MEYVVSCMHVQWSDPLLDLVGRWRMGKMRYLCVVSKLWGTNVPVGLRLMSSCMFDI